MDTNITDRETKVVARFSGNGSARCKMIEQVRDVNDMKNTLTTLFPTVALKRSIATIFAAFLAFTALPNASIITFPDR